MTAKKKIEEMDEVAELELELKKATLKLQILKANSDFRQLKRAMNDPGPEQRQPPKVDPF